MIAFINRERETIVMSYKFFTQEEIDFFRQEHKEKVLRDYYAIIEDAREEAFKEGRREEKIRIAINCLKLGLAPDIVAKGVNLSVDEVLKLQSK